MVKILNEMAEEVEFVSESFNGESITRIKGLFSTTESKNRNGRVYPDQLFEREVLKLQEKISRGSVLGELEHPQRVSIDYENAVIKLDKLEKQGNKIFGEASVIPAGKGLIIQGLIKVGAEIGVSSRGTGSLTDSKNGKLVNEDFNLITYDIVKDPSNYDSYLNAIEESKNYIIEANGSLVEAYNQLEKDLEKLPHSKREEIMKSAILKFINNL